MVYQEKTVYIRECLFKKKEDYQETSVEFIYLKLK